MQKIAVYDNASGIAGKLELLCRGEQLSIVVERTREHLLFDLENRDIQMVLLDMCLDDAVCGEGLFLIANLRRQCQIPVIVVSSEANETAKVAALSMGADDYLNADDNLLVIMAHVKAQLRRYHQLTKLCTNISPIYRVDGLVVDDTQRKVTVDGRDVKLTPIEYQILKLLVMEKGKVFSISQIYEDIWKMQAVDVDNTVAVHVRHIREKIEQNPRKPRYLKVIWGTGYMVG
ncbi:MAG: response regulator transcription factor [Lachnospiraceae bacterium]|nr:response regulator transcription factor [Lachnospiraceae bacterium]